MDSQKIYPLYSVHVNLSKTEICLHWKNSLVLKIQNTIPSKTNRLKTVCLNFVSIHFCSIHASSDLSEKGHSCYKWGRIKTYYWKVCANTCVTRSAAAEENKNTVILYTQRIKPYIIHIHLKWGASHNTFSFFLHTMLLIVLGCITAYESNWWLSFTVPQFNWFPTLKTFSFSDPNFNISHSLVLQSIVPQSEAHPITCHEDTEGV